LVEDCDHGDLDPRYCDENGDLVADAPSDSSMGLDPDRLIFAYTPVEDPAQFRGVWAGFLAHLEKAVSRDVLFFPVQSTRPRSKPCGRGDFTLRDSIREVFPWQ
jgi:phosphonate transport system substrate-binding protein